MKRLLLMSIAPAFTAFAQPPEPYRLEVLSRTTDFATLRAPQCRMDAWISVTQTTGVIEHGEVGAYVLVTGYPSLPDLNGLYRITRFSFRRDQNRAHIDSSFDAICIVTPNPLPR